MRWFLFFIFPGALLSCTNGKEKNVPVSSTQKDTPLAKREISYNDTVHFPYDSYSDSGYFKGYIPETFASLEDADHTELFTFISNNFNKKDIRLLDKEALSNSVFLDQKTETRIDTLRNSRATIISIYRFGGKPSQIIKINGAIVKNYKSNTIEFQDQDIFDIWGSSFRDFAYKGKEYYYMKAGIMDCKGGSACAGEYHLIYDPANKILNEFFTFRVNSYYFMGDANGDEKLDYLAIENYGMFPVHPDTPNYFTMRLFSDNGRGKFVQQKDKSGKQYFIEGNSGTNLYVGDTMRVGKYHWPVKLK